MPKSSSHTGTTGSVGFFGLLALLFIGLKLGDIIDWSWGWVLAPLWAPLTIVLITWLSIVVITVTFLSCVGLWRKA
jgi:hypothetical protein